MAESRARRELGSRLRRAAEQDERIVGLIEYGSGGEGRADEWSDLDLTVIVRDQDFEQFSCDWQQWAGQFGSLLLAFVGRYGHPWAIFDTTPLPLRLDLYLLRESRVDDVLLELTCPISVESMVWYDGTNGRLSGLVRMLVGRCDRPADAATAFAAACGDFWYFLLHAYSKLQRGEHWAARQIYQTEVMRALFLLLRLEAGGAALDRWCGAVSAVGVEQTLQRDRLVQLEQCVPSTGIAGLRQALGITARLGFEVCGSLGRPWPEALGNHLLQLLDAPMHS